MKKRILISALYICVSIISIAQQKDIEFKVEDLDKNLSIICLNNSEFMQEVELTINNIKGLKGYSNPINKTLPPKSKTLFIDLTYEYIYGYELSYSKKRVESEEEKLGKAASKKLHYLDDLTKINDGIVIFDDIECARCSYATNYLMEKNVDFKIVNISNNKDNLKLMWKTIKEKGQNMHVKTPVIIVNGKLSHSHADLKNFLEGLR